MGICERALDMVRHNFGDVRLTTPGETAACACGVVTVVAEMGADRILWVVICTKVQ